MSTQPDSTPQATAEVPDKGVGCDALFASLSSTQKKCVTAIRDSGGVITRFQGGFWCAGTAHSLGKSFGTSTIESLVKRGVLKYCEYKTNKHPAWGTFPIKARLYPEQPPVDNEHVAPGCELFSVANHVTCDPHENF